MYKNTRIGESGNPREPLNFALIDSPLPTASASGRSSRIFKIPETWFDDNLENFLSPGLDVVISGAKFWDWGTLTFKKHRYPGLDWIELPIFDFIADLCTPSNLFLSFVCLQNIIYIIYLLLI